MGRGRRESHWLVIRRCLAIIRRAQRGPTDWRGLRDAVFDACGEDAYGAQTDEAQQHKRLSNDLGRIRHQLFIDLEHDERLGGYVIKDTWTPLLDLPDDCLETIAWIDETFGPASPHDERVRALVDRLRLYLGMQRASFIDRARPALDVDLRARDSDDIKPGVWRTLERALRQRRRLAIDYLSPRYADGEPRRHVVAPHELTFDTARGHTYLRAVCLETDSASAPPAGRGLISYRVGRIQAARVLPAKLSPLPPSERRAAVAYELAPEVARLGVSDRRWIAIEDVERRRDGSALVRGTTTDVFWAVQELLHYGATCRVVGGPEMVRRMREVVAGMARLYEME
jgi:hypothetical protein